MFHLVLLLVVTSLLLLTSPLLTGLVLLLWIIPAMYHLLFKTATRQLTVFLGPILVALVLIKLQPFLIAVMPHAVIRFLAVLFMWSVTIATLLIWSSRITTSEQR